MVFHIAKKEFLNNLLSARFIIGFLLCLVLIPFSILISVNNYQDRTGQYRIDRDQAEKSFTEVRVYSYLQPEVVLPPKPLSIFSKGISDQIGNRVKILLGTKPMLAAGKTAAGDNPFLASLFSVDFVDIAAIIFSLLAFIFSYDALSREKEDGTLRLQMANPLPRSTCLAGKILGILLTLLPILLFSFLLAALLISFSGHISLTSGEWGRIALLFAASLLYLSVFVFIGLFVSARSKSSVTGLVACLFLWVLFVFIIPSVAANFAESFVRVESRENLNKVMAELDEECVAKYRQAQKAQGLPEWDSYEWGNMGDDGSLETYANPRQDFDRIRRKTMISALIRIDYADKKWAVQKDYIDSLARQGRAAERLSLVSPTGIFRTVASFVCATDLRSHERELDRLRQYRETFIRFLRDRDLFASFQWITAAPPESFHTQDELIALRTGGEFKTEKEYDAWAAKQPDYRVRSAKLQKVKLHGDVPQDFPFLNVSDVPRFQDRQESLRAGSETSVVYAGILIFEMILLFSLGFVAFIRYDVR
jgi:ABC-type transport system involved in multi-copper enzyme maturation permease subunit